MNNSSNKSASAMLSNSDRNAVCLEILAEIGVLSARAQNICSGMFNSGIQPVAALDMISQLSSTLAVQQTLIEACKAEILTTSSSSTSTSTPSSRHHHHHHHHPHPHHEQAHHQQQPQRQDQQSQQPNFTILLPASTRSSQSKPSASAATSALTAGIGSLLGSAALNPVSSSESPSPHHTATDDLYPDPLLLLGTPDDGTRSKHVDVVGDAAGDSPEDLFQGTGEDILCDICYKSFSTKATLRIHRRIHDESPRYSCPVCGKLFRQSAGLYQHKRVVHKQPSDI